MFAFTTILKAVITVAWFLILFFPLEGLLP